MLVFQVKKGGWLYFRAIPEVSTRLLVIQVHHIQRSADRKVSLAVQFFYPAAEIASVVEKRRQLALKNGKDAGPELEAGSYWEHALIRTNEVGSISHRDVVGQPHSVLGTVCGVLL